MTRSKLLIHLRSSLWFVPVMCVLAAALFSFATIALDRLFDYKAIPQSVVGGAIVNAIRSIASAW